MAAAVREIREETGIALDPQALRLAVSVHQRNPSGHVINEPTASVFTIRRDRQHGWLITLVWHPRLGCWLRAGGHVELDEPPAQAAVARAKLAATPVTKREVIGV